MAAAGRRTNPARASPRGAVRSPPATSTAGLRTPPGGDRCRGLAARRRATRTWTAITTPTATATSTATRAAAGRATATARGTTSTTRRGRNRSTRSRMAAGRAISDRPAPPGDRRAGAADSAGATASPIVAGETAAGTAAAVAGTAAASAGAAASRTAVSEVAASAGAGHGAVAASAASAGGGSAGGDRHHDRKGGKRDAEGEGGRRGVGGARGRGDGPVGGGIQESRGEPQQAAHQLLHRGGRHPRASEREGEHAPADGGGAADHRPHQHRGGPRHGHFQDQRPGRERRVQPDDRRADRGDQVRVWASLGAPMPAGLQRRQRP